MDKKSLMKKKKKNVGNRTAPIRTYILDLRNVSGLYLINIKVILQLFFF